MQYYGKRIQVGDTEINIYTEGSGSLTLLFMAGSGVGCPALEYKPVYKRISDRYHIAVIEKAGYGLSGKATSKRTVENLVEESRAALALTWQQAAKDYAAQCNADIHLLNEGHMLYAKIPDKVAELLEAFLLKIETNENGNG